MDFLPQPVTDLFEAVNAHDTERLLTTFSPDALVTDDGHTYRGHDAIRKWNERETVAAKVVLTPAGAATEDDWTVVDVRADGDFDGSPLPFVFRFRLAGPDAGPGAGPGAGRIAELTITFAG